MTAGPILELGCGMYSTPFLHWACFPTRRTLVTLEGQEAWMPYADQFVHTFHTVEYVADWEALDLSRDWSIAFVDHDAGIPRGDTVGKLLHAEYVVCHDSERTFRYKYDLVFPKFKWRYQYRGTRMPWTMVLSNVHNLKGFSIP